jgi:DNA topoisomerase I
MDKAIPSGSRVQPGISIRNGPVQEMDLDDAPLNGKATVTGKRKSRSSLNKSYKEASSGSEDDKPIV